jgi:hypothetical protein
MTAPILPTLPNSLLLVSTWLDPLIRDWLVNDLFRLCIYAFVTPRGVKQLVRFAEKIASQRAFSMNLFQHFDEMKNKHHFG